VWSPTEPCYLRVFFHSSSEMFKSQYEMYIDSNILFIGEASTNECIDQYHVTPEGNLGEKKLD
jgi:hypothetical protein